MEVNAAKTLFGAQIVQIAWVVKDIKATERFFREVMGIGDFYKMENFSTKEFDPTYYGEPAETLTHTYQAYSGGMFIELIQPISGRSIFQDYLDKNPAGGVQHIAYRIPIADLDDVISGMNSKGYPVITTYDTPIAKIVFFDTYKELGVATEVMGVTEEGIKAIDKMKSGKS
jgi:hypothetical protein